MSLDREVFLLNSFGERIKKVTYSQNQKKVTYYLYDNRTLVAEIDGDTLEYRQNIYLKNTPVAHLIGKTTYAVHTDNIGTPKLLTDNDGKTVWEAAHTPLGQAVIDKQDIPFNLRFPGQYADVETGTHYNYLRDYDPKTGRYLTSDPAGLDGGDNTYSYANNNVLGLTDVLGLSPQLPNLPIFANADSEPFSTDYATNGAQNPSDLVIDPTEQGITDPNQLVLNFRAIGSGCSVENEVHFNTGIERWVETGQFGIFDPSHLYGELHRLRVTAGDDDPNRVVLESMESIGVDENSFVLVLGECSDDDQAIKDEVRRVLGNLVHDDELDNLIASLKPAVGGCRPAQLVNLTDLHEEVLNRFQVKLTLNPEVVAAERELILAQGLFDDFVRMYGEVCEGFIVDTDLCTAYYKLQYAVWDAGEFLAETLDRVYQQQVDDGDLPQHDVDAINDARRNQIMLGALGMLIPLTLEDAAIDAALLGVGRVGRLLTGSVDVLRAFRTGNRAGLENLTSSAVAGQRAKAVKMDAYKDDSVLNGLDYATIVQLENKIGAENIRGLSADEVVSITRGWCSFAGDTLVLTQHGYQEIKNIIAGEDLVWARDESTGTMDWRNVLAQYSNEYDNTVHVTVIDDRGHQQTIRSNRIHPYFARPQAGTVRTSMRAVLKSSEGHVYDGGINGGFWIDAQHLKAGDELLSDNGEWQTVKAVQIESTQLTAYNLTVDEYSTYFVAGNDKASPVWVHNVCHGYPNQFPDDATSVLDRTNQQLGRNGDGGVLAHNLEQVGFTRPDGVGSTAHHIIPTGNYIRNPKVQQIKDLLDGLDPPFDINEASNGVFLPRNKNFPDDIAPNHLTIHTKDYFDNLYDRLSGVDPDEIRSELQAIAKELSENNFEFKKK